MFKVSDDVPLGAHMQSGISTPPPKHDISTLNLNPHWYLEQILFNCIDWSGLKIVASIVAARDAFARASERTRNELGSRSTGPLGYGVQGGNRCSDWKYDNPICVFYKEEWNSTDGCPLFVHATATCFRYARRV
ncbi:hypothetical protein ACJJTC_015425 [Scirpophaga incertulas]